MSDTENNGSHDHESPSGGKDRPPKDANDIEVRLLIPSKTAGSIIGKGGSIISRIRSEYPAHINIPDCPGPERIVTVSGPQTAVIKVVEEIIIALDESAMVKGEADIRLLTHMSTAGAIIGKGGAKIKDLREMCGGIVKVFSNSCPQSTDRVIQVMGELQRVVQTVTNVIESLQTSIMKGADHPYNPFNCEELFAHEYGGWGDPANPKPGFGPMQGGPMGMGSPMGGGANNVPIRGGGPMGGSHYSSANDRLGGDHYHDRHHSSSHSNRRSDSGRDRDRERDRDRRGNSRGPFSPPRSSDDYERDGKGYGGQSLMGTPSDNLTTTTQVTIPKDAAGAIIGKAGTRIRKIRHESGCAINIEDCRAGSDDRIITITGSDQQIKHAQYLLQQSVREHGNYGNEGGDRRY